jgi:hypothetical protein
MTATFVPGADAPKTRTRAVALDIVHGAVVPPTVAVQAPPCAEVMKLVPVTVMELLR